MITNTRWMTAVDLADRLDVTSNAIRNAFSTKGTCAGFKIQRREVKPGEDFGRSRFVFRGMGGTAKVVPPPVTDRPLTKKAAAASEAATIPPATPSAGKESAANDDMTAWQTRDQLAETLGCQPKSVRNAWEKGSRVSGYNIERRGVAAGEKFGRAKFLYRGVQKRDEDVVVDESELRWMRISELADRLGVHPNSVRIAAEKDTRCQGHRILRRRVKPGEVSNGRVRFLFSMVPKKGDAEAASSVDTSDQATDSPTAWMVCTDLAQLLGVHHNAVRFACDKGHLCRGFEITRRRVIPTDHVSGRTSYMYRAEAGGPVANLKSTDVLTHESEAPSEEKPVEPVKVEPKPVAQTSSPMPKSGVVSSNAVDVANLLEYAAGHCETNPHDAAAILRFLAAWVVDEQSR